MSRLRYLFPRASLKKAMTKCAEEFIEKVLKPNYPEIIRFIDHKTILSAGVKIFNPYYCGAAFYRNELGQTLEVPSINLFHIIYRRTLNSKIKFYNQKWINSLPSLEKMLFQSGAKVYAIRDNKIYTCEIIEVYNGKRDTLYKFIPKIIVDNTFLQPNENTLLYIVKILDVSCPVTKEDSVGKRQIFSFEDVWTITTDCYCVGCGIFGYYINEDDDPKGLLKWAALRCDIGIGLCTSCAQHDKYRRRYQKQLKYYPECNIIQNITL
jgi:hypothetical protein